MTVIEIILVCLIIWVASMIGIAHKNGGYSFGGDEWFEIILGGLLVSIVIILSLGILGAFIYGLWNAPWYDLFHNKLW